jgi:hypothetical protein
MLNFIALIINAEEYRGAYRVLVGNLRESNHLEDKGLEVRIILKWIFKK